MRRFKKGHKPISTPLWITCIYSSYKEVFFFTICLFKIIKCEFASKISLVERKRVKRICCFTNYFLRIPKIKRILAKVSKRERKPDNAHTYFIFEIIFYSP